MLDLEHFHRILVRDQDFPCAAFNGDAGHRDHGQEEKM
jgi:hypothetical protein